METEKEGDSHSQTRQTDGDRALNREIDRWRQSSRQGDIQTDRWRQSSRHGDTQTDR